MLDVLTGATCPSGKLNETYAYSLEDVASTSYYPAIERSSEYREGLYMGYRYFDTAGVKVRFPFGFGLSYTTFAYSDLTVDGGGVTFTITNTGECDGAEIAQMYVGQPSVWTEKGIKGLCQSIFEKGRKSAGDHPI